MIKLRFYRMTTEPLNRENEKFSWKDAFQEITWEFKVPQFPVRSVVFHIPLLQ